MHANRFWLNRLLLLIAGALTAFAFAPYYLVFILLFTLSFLFFKINELNKKRELFGTGFWFGFGLGSVSTSWIAHALMIDGGEYALFVPVAWLGMGILFGLFFAVPAFLSFFFKKGYPRLFAWSALVTIFEWIRSWFLTGFPWNLMGSVWENTLSILQTASVIGVYGLTFITLITCSSLAFLPSKKPFFGSLFFLAILCGIGAWRLYDALEENVTGVKIRIVQPNIPQTLKWDPKEADNSLNKLISLSRKNNDQITHVIWPESSVPFLVNRDENERLRLMQALRQGGTLILGGMRWTQDREEPIANSLFVLDDMASVRAFSDKSHLVPFGEYVPLRGLLHFEKVVPIPYDFKSSDQVRTIKALATPALGALICYEVIFSGRVVDKDHRPMWLVNLTNDGWYGISAGPYQHLGMAKMRAVEEGLPLVRAANTGISAVFDPYGRTLESLDLGGEGIIDSSLPMPLPPTLYARFGISIPVGVCCILLLFLFWKQKSLDKD